MTPFRKTQDRAVLEGTVRWLAPMMMGPNDLRRAVAELHADHQLWGELAAAQPDVPQTASQTSLLETL